MDLEEKIRRRLTPFVVEGRIREPAIRSLDGNGLGHAYEIDIAPNERGFAPTNLERDLRAALSDLAAQVLLRVAPAAT